MEMINTRLMNWASILEPKTKAQAQLTAIMPFIHPHLALMPDAHLGKGATVGSVIPTLGAIMPAAVGVDIGCGMIAVKTQWHEDEFRAMFRNNLKPLREQIEFVIPLSAGNYNTAVFRDSTKARITRLEDAANAARFDPAQYAANWRLQLGTLGSGNHFIEISIDEDHGVWLFLHSGSRGVGNKIAQHHIKVAQAMNKRWYIDLPDPDLAYLVEGTDEFWNYIRELRWAQEFALVNREEMMNRVMDSIGFLTGQKVEPGQTINCHHNYTEQETHFGKKVWLSRKGAINAEEGRWGLIPGSMGAASYVVQGKGNRLALNSSPHGAGRNYGRNVARKMFDMTSLEEAMGGVEWRHTDAFLDEHPLAYKDIDVVMEDSKDLVDIRFELRQILNCKGD